MTADQPDNEPNEGKSIQLSGDFRHGIVNVESTLTGVTQKVINNPTYIVQETPPLWADVPPMPPHFMGRGALVEQLVEQLTSGRALALAIEGLPGVGKTALAKALAHHQDVLAYFADGVLWASLGRQADVMSTLGNWAAALGLDNSQLVEVEQRKQAVRWAIGQRKLLLIIDDVWEPDAAEAMRCGGPNCVHLLTSRDKGLARQFAGAGQVFGVPTLGSEPTLALLQAIAPEAYTSDPEAVQQLARAMGGLPLAIQLLGSYLARPESSYFPALQTKALAKMSNPQQRLQLAAARLGRSGQKVTLYDTIALSLEGLREMEHGEQAVAAFYALGAFAPDPETFSVNAAKAVADCDEKVLALLVARNLVVLQGEHGEQLALHQTIADVAQTGLGAAATQRHRDYYLSLVNENQKDWQRIETAYGQIKWAWEHRQPEDVLVFVDTLAIYQMTQGLWPDYLAWAKVGLEQAKDERNKHSEGALLNNIGQAYRSLGQWRQALDYYNRALPIVEDIDDRLGLANTLNNIGLIYSKLGQQEQALDFCSRALPIREEVGDHSGLAATLSSLGLAHYRLGQWQQALEYYDRALAIQEEVGDRIGLAATLSSVGLIYNSVGQREQAVDFYTRALAIQEKAGNQVGLAQTLNNLGLVYASLGQWEKVLDFYNRALSIQEEIGHQAGISQALNNIGGVYHNLEQWEQALEFYGRALTIMEGAGYQQGVATTFSNMGSIHSSLGQHEKALDFFNRALSIQAEIRHQAGLATTLSNIGSVHSDLEQWEQALEFYNRALSVQEEIGHQAGIAAVCNNIGSTHNSLGQRGQAINFYNRALLIMEGIGDLYGESVTRYNLAMVYRAQRNLDQAVTELEQAAELARQVQSPNLETHVKTLAEVQAEVAAQQDEN